MNSSIRSEWRKRARAGEVLAKKERTSPKWCEKCGGKFKRRGKNHDAVNHS